MRDFERILIEREVEITAHLNLVAQLEAAATGRGTGITAPIETEPVNILKSGYLVHLYNVVEAVMTLIIEEVSVSAQAHPPKTWSDGLLREWSRGRVNMKRDIEINKMEDRVFNLLVETASRKAVERVPIGKASGNWSNEEIASIATRLGCNLTIPAEVNQAACTQAFSNGMAPMKFLRHKRNMLAHGTESFADSARSFTTARLAELQAPAFEYMRAVVAAFDVYIDEELFLVS
jgi:hypothetical protein